MSSQPISSILINGNSAATHSIPLAKRWFDIVGSLGLLLAFSPIFFVVYILAKRDGGPALFAHQRVGQNGTLFGCLKFRTMVPDAEARLADILDRSPAARIEWDATHKLTSDPRITPMGAFLRKTSLDELPQLVNILRGQMSLVGPRPVTEAEIPRYGVFARRVFSHRPGLTGLWQVGGRNDISYDERVAIDLSYCNHPSFLLDIKILVATARTVLARSGK